MIFIENNKVNPIVLNVSSNMNICSEFVFEFINSTTNDIKYFVTDNVSTSISYFDLFSLEENSNIPQKKYSFNEPINLNNGQYTVYLYKCKVLPINESELLDIIKEENKVFVTKMVVELDTNINTNIQKKYL